MNSHMKFCHYVKFVVSPPTVPPYHLRPLLHHHRPGVGVMAGRPSPLLVWGAEGGAASCMDSEVECGPGYYLLPKPASPVKGSEFQ